MYKNDKVDGFGCGTTTKVRLGGITFKTFVRLVGPKEGNAGKRKGFLLKNTYQQKNRCCLTILK